MHPALILVVLVAALLLYSWYQRAPASQRRQARNRALLVGGIGLLLILAVTGRLNPVFAAGAALLAVGYRLLGVLQALQSVKAFRNSFKGAQGPSPGQTSTVETRFLHMTLDHDTGAMSGEVREGPHAGKRLDMIDLEGLLELLAQCRAEDPQSAKVLEAYLERTHGEAWRERDEQPEPPSRVAGMTRDQARKILGVGAEASRQEIIDAHRRLMQKLHPDRGGSTFLAAQINQAKDLLLGSV